MIVECSFCGEETNKFPYELDRNKNHYCGYKCRDNARKTKRIASCDECEKEIERNPYRLQTYKKQFCSLECKTENMRTGYINSGGYKVFSVPKDHPLRVGRRQVFEHWLVMYEEDPKFTLWAKKNGWTIHHINGIKDDNGRNNLQWKAPGTHGSGIHVMGVSPEAVLSRWYELLAAA